MFSDCAILAFHQTSNRFYPGINNIKPDRFFQILDLIGSWGFHAAAGTSDSDPENRIIITFDDGYRDNFDILDRLCTMGIKPILFIPSDYIGRQNHWEYSSLLFTAWHLDADRIKKLSENGVIIGSHGASHKSLVGMDTIRLKDDLIRSKNTLEDIIGRTVDLISFPFGRTDSRVNDIARECGFRYGFVLGTLRKMDDGNGFVLPRIPIYGIDDYYSLKSKLAGSRLESFKDIIINDLAAGTIIVGKRTQIKRNRSEIP